MELSRCARFVHAHVVDRADTAVETIGACFWGVLAIARGVARFDRAQIPVLAHVGLIVRTFVDEAVAIVVRAVAFFNFAMGDAPVNRVCRRARFAVESRRAFRHARFRTELFPNVIFRA